MLRRPKKKKKKRYGESVKEARGVVRVQCMRGAAGRQGKEAQREEWHARGKKNRECSDEEMRHAQAHEGALRIKRKYMRARKMRRRRRVRMQSSVCLYYGEGI